MHDIALIEELAANAVPPAITQMIDGWRIRFNFGFTRRANSVLAERHGDRQELPEKLALVEGFYARHNVPPRFQICPASQPSDLDAILEQRGYRVDPDVTSVQIAPIDAVARHDPGFTQVAEQPDPAWLAAYWQSEAISEPRKQQAQATMLARIGPAAGFATLPIDGRIAALALGVVERGYLGVFSVATLPEFRRRGLATQVLAGLAQWAQQHNAQHCYLQVMRRNSGAIALYERLGFEPRYDYWYRVQS